MSIENKNRILSHHPYLRLSLAHAAIGTFPCHNLSHMVMVNRIIIVLSDTSETDSYIGDCQSGKKLKMQPGYLYFVPCNLPSDWNFSSELQFISIHFNLELFFGFDVFRNYSTCISLEAPLMALELENIIHREEEIISLCQLNEVIYYQCIKLINMHPELIQNNNIKWHNYEIVFEYIQKHGNAKTTVDQLAGLLNIRNNVFSRKFTRDMGITPKKFLLNTLTMKASKLLMIPGSSIKEVSNQLEFSSEFYFSNFFKRQTGISPREFQRHY